MIGIEQLTVRFGRVRAVDGVTLQIPEGEWLTLIGANGAGKTSLLRAIAQLERYEGGVRVDDQLLSELPPRRRARLVAYLPQSPQVPADMSVIDYVLVRA
jgi:iron complex transport system ATP-binding protein